MDQIQEGEVGRGEAAQRRVRTITLPGFLHEDEVIGLGDVVKRATSTVGVRPCGKCEARASLLNRWLVFSAPRKS